MPFFIARFALCKTWLDGVHEPQPEVILQRGIGGHRRKSFHIFAGARHDQKARPCAILTRFDLRLDFRRRRIYFRQSPAFARSIRPSCDSERVRARLGVHALHAVCAAQAVEKRLAIDLHVPIVAVSLVRCKGTRPARQTPGLLDHGFPCDGNQAAGRFRRKSCARRRRGAGEHGIAVSGQVCRSGKQRPSSGVTPTPSNRCPSDNTRSAVLISTP